MEMQLCGVRYSRKSADYGVTVYDVTVEMPIMGNDETVKMPITLAQQLCKAFLRKCMR
jgi:hypothetical protein